MAPVAQAGARLDDRYVLDTLCHAGPGIELWQATDEVLGRRVAIRILAAQTRTQRREITLAAARAGQVPDARWVRVLDLGSAATGSRFTVWVVSEWVEGSSLASTIRRAPLPAPAAVALVRSCAQAVGTAERHHASHGRLHPDDVLLPADAGPRLSGLELSRVLHPQSRDAGSSYDDTQGLGGLLYAALTGCWPLPGRDGLPAPARGDGRHPRQERRRGISRELDEITARALSGAYPGADALLRDLATLPATGLDPAPSDAERTGGRRWRTIGWRVVPPLLVTAIGIGAWLAGSSLGRVPGQARQAAPGSPAPNRSTGTAGRGLVWSSPPRVSGFGTQGTVAVDPGGVGLAVDDDPSTEWTTGTYPDTKTPTGIGLLLDLPRPRTVDIAELLLSAPGAAVEIRAGSTRPDRAGDLPIVASRVDSAQAVRLRLTRPVRARYWLVWFTTLPKSGPHTSRLGVAEIALLR